MSAPPIATLLAAGAQTPLGLDLCQTSMLLRAGFASMGEAALGAEGEGVITCRSDALAETLIGAERLVQLAEPPFAEVLDALGPTPARMLFVLSLDATLSEADVEHVAGKLGAMLRKRVSEARLEVVRLGAGGGAPVVAGALSRNDVVLWGGVHSDHDPWAIARLVAADRLYADDNLDAVMPGEAAAFVALASGARSDGIAQLFGIGHAVEAARPDNDVPAAPARGLTAAMRAATYRVDDVGRAGWLLSDVGLETWRLMEWQTLITRAANVLTAPYRLDNPAQRLGSLGAAGAVLGLALAADGFARGHAPSPNALVLAGGDEGQRCAILLRQR
jgi:3-oxoacyl-[acyl-carrier-protein] synthase I